MREEQSEILRCPGFWQEGRGGRHVCSAWPNVTRRYDDPDMRPTMRHLSRQLEPIHCAGKIDVREQDRDGRRISFQEANSRVCRYVRRYIPAKILESGCGKLQKERLIFDHYDEAAFDARWVLQRTYSVKFTAVTRQAPRQVNLC
jgi:hypothetical protein